MVMFVYSGACTFEGGICQWTQDKSEDDFDWQLTSGGTTSYLTGPSSDHTFGNSSGKSNYQKFPFCFALDDQNCACRPSVKSW